jgi:hypothetical protein
MASLHETLSDAPLRAADCHAGELRLEFSLATCTWP